MITKASKKSRECAEQLLAVCLDINERINQVANPKSIIRQGYWVLGITSMILFTIRCPGMLEGKASFENIFFTVILSFAITVTYLLVAYLYVCAQLGGEEISDEMYVFLGEKMEEFSDLEGLRYLRPKLTFSDLKFSVNELKCALESELARPARTRFLCPDGESKVASAPDFSFSMGNCKYD